MRLVSLLILYAIHLNDNSLFCVFTSLDVICSPNSLFITETMVSFVSCIFHVSSGLVHVHILGV